MRLLVLGALGPYPERLSLFTQDGHELWFAATLTPPSPEQLGQVRLIDMSTGLAADKERGVHFLLDLMARERIEAVYSLLNVWDGSVPITAALLRCGCPVPLVRHYKEHYMFPWDDERTTIEQASGAIFINPESRSYFEGIYTLPRLTACIDADLLPRRYLQGPLRPKLSSSDGRAHLLVIGSTTDDGGRYDYRDLIREVTALGAHVHIYGQFRRMNRDGHLLPNDEVEQLYRQAAPEEYLHLHKPVGPESFVEEWSVYDAGLLHMPRADDRFRALNVPNRYSAYVAAGLPVAVPAGEMPAMQRHLEELGVGLVYDGAEDLVNGLPDKRKAERALAVRESVTFEAVYPGIMSFIESVCSLS